MAIETGLEGRPWYVGALVGVVVAAGLGYLGYILQIEDQWTLRDEQESRLARLQTRIARGRAAKAKLPQFREELTVLEEELEKLLLILPPTRDVPDVLRRFRALAEDGDFVLNQFSPAAEIEHEVFNEWPISVELQGTYHNLAAFFDRMSRFSRIFNVDDLKVEKKPQGRHSIAATFTAKTFVYKKKSARRSTKKGKR